MENFNKLTPSERISSINVVIVSLALITTVFSWYFGYSINKAVEERNKLDWKIEQASIIRDFWKDIEHVEQGFFEQTRLVGVNAGKFIGASVEIINELEYLKTHKRSLKITPENMKLNIAFATLISTYASLQASTEIIAIKYDNSVLAYSSIVDALGIKGWVKYLEQGSELIEWKANTIEPYRKVYNLIVEITKSGKIPENIEVLLVQYAEAVPSPLKNIAPPSLKGLMTFKTINHPLYKK